MDLSSGTITTHLYLIYSYTWATCTFDAGGTGAFVLAASYIDDSNAEYAVST
jgi:hypothetical protein